MSDLPEIHYDDAGTQRVVFTLPPADAPDQASVLVFALPKSGSVLLDRIMRELSSKVRLCYVSIMEEYFSRGIPDELQPAATSRIFLPKGYCYGGFRYMPPFAIPIIPTVRKILLVRDPRDMVVSHYYSMLKSHPARVTAIATKNLAKELDVDAYVKRIAPAYREYLSGYRALCTTCGMNFFGEHGIRDRFFLPLVTAARPALRLRIRVYRYEDIIYSKEEWVRDICHWLGFAVSEEIRRKIVKRHDVIPTSEREDKHVRQVHPGNYRAKLSPDTIRYLTEYFAEDMKFFGYRDKN